MERREKIDGATERLVKFQVLQRTRQSDLQSTPRESSADKPISAKDVWEKIKSFVALRAARESDDSSVARLDASAPRITSPSFGLGFSKLFGGCADGGCMGLGNPPPVKIDKSFWSKQRSLSKEAERSFSKEEEDKDMLDALCAEVFPGLCTHKDVVR